MKLIYNYNLFFILKDLRIVIKKGFNFNIYLNIINIIPLFNNLINDYNIFKDFIKIVNKFKE
jgi:hypothetical protein